MFKIVQRNGDDYIVNQYHILSLKYCSHKSIFNTARGYSLKWFDKETFRVKTKNFKNEKDAELFQNTIDDSDVFDIPIKDYLNIPSSTRRCLMGFKLFNSIQWIYKKVELDPYILGMWLGDGTSSRPSFTSIDKELVEYWSNWAKDNDCEVVLHKDGSNIHYGIKAAGNKKGVKGCNNFTNLLSKYNLVNNKHIPEDYIINDKKTRLSVLAGLIDTDGSVEQDGKTIRISQSVEHKNIIDGARFIASSLGFQTSIKNKKTSWVSQQEKKSSIALVLTISGDGIQDIPTLLPRKKCVSYLSRNATSYNIKVIPVGIGKYNGFEIDKNNRFILGDFTVTHNCEQTGRTVIGPDPTLRMGQLALPPEMASNLTFPENVTAFNIEHLTQLVNNGKANFVIRTKLGSKTRINLQYALFSKGTELLYGDVITRKSKDIIYGKHYGHFELKEGDIIKRNGELLENITYPKKKKFILQIGDIVERHLKNGDIVLLNRQPTLHSGSMMAKEIVIRPGKTIRMNLSCTKSFNADFDKILC